MKTMVRTMVAAGLTMLLGAGVCGCGSSEQKAAEGKTAAITQPKTAEELANAVGKAAVEGATTAEIDNLFAKDAKGKRVDELRKQLESGNMKADFEKHFGKGKKIEYGGGEIRPSEKSGNGVYGIQVGLKIDGKFYTGPDFYGKEIDGVWKIVGE